MRGTVVKAIRREVYGDYSFRGRRNYYRVKKTGAIILDPNGRRSKDKKMRREVKRLKKR